ncbi:Hypothetical predicted protein [Mytilus galloprovincialis]|uniref:Letm1 RBD domain-containing protein n=1 Tax=Mytilus galloprovincialis TaxID=29158 RepID=A0A8B6HAY6_MYTGA|nr:Hypothetical predicted protein [Mytilus galloprovincialis]
MQSFKDLSRITYRRKIFRRYYCSHPQDTLGPPGRLKRYLVNKFVKTIEKCENFVETNNPTAFKFYKTFKVGFNDLLEDTKTYYQVSKDIWYNSKELHTFSRKELVIYQQLENSLHPTVEEILEVKPVFETYNFKAEKLSFAYSRHLAKTFGFSLRRSKLVQEGLLVLHTDRAIVREGFNSMTEEDINMSCLSRGLNPYGIKRDEKENYLESWTQISKEVDEHSMSLLLHGPVLLALNHPSNRHLLGGKKFRWRRKKKKEVV